MARQFVFNWRVSLFAAVCLIGFVNLGLWQLGRAEEKRQLLIDREQMAQLPPLPANALPDDSDPDFEPGKVRVSLTGSFAPETWLLDNRVLEGVVGFEVLQAFNEATGRDFVVNRGFVPMGRTRDDVPVIPAVPGDVTITGKLKAFQPGVVIGEVAVPALDGDPVIVQQADIAALAESSGLAFYPHLVLLADNAPGALPRYWPDTVMLPAQHKGYAVQWFAMAFAVVVVWGFFTWRKTDE